MLQTLLTRGAPWAWMVTGLLFGAGISRAQAPAQGGRPLAPGVLTVIPPDIQYEETYTGPFELPEIVRGMPQRSWKPHFTPQTRTLLEQARRTILRREVWCLEFAFKPVRMVEVDVPQPSGKMQRKKIWYMVYRVRYLGEDLAPKAVPDQWQQNTYSVEPIARQQRYFFPMAILRSHETGKEYPDRIIPAAVEVIEKRERPDGPLHNSVTITRVPLRASDGRVSYPVWGVFTWEDVDPEIDYFSIDIRGLTNAYRPVEQPDQFQPGDPPGKGRSLLAKTLRLNFWRPGDSLDEHEEEIRYGVPTDPDPAERQRILKAYGLEEHLDYLWVYR